MPSNTLLHWLQSAALRLRSRIAPLSGVSAPDPLDLPLLWLSDADAFTVRDACEGVQIFGGTGSGKTSGSGAALARAFLTAGFGGLVLCAKNDERALWERYAAETGREEDLLIFGPAHPWRFNFLDYELNRPGEGGGLTENIVRLFSLALEAGGRSRGGGESPFWEDALKELLRNAVELVALATGNLSLADMYEAIDSAPTSTDLRDSKEWRDQSACFACLEAAERNAQTPERRQDYLQTERYWMSRFPQLAPETRSAIVQSFSSVADPFLRHPMRTLFCSETNLTPEASQQGKVILLDLPVKEYGHVGVFAQVLFKLAWQQATERRDVRQSPLPVFLWADESQYFVTGYDALFQTTARSSRACTVYLTQNLPTYSTEFGRDGKDKALSLLGNLQTKIFHANGDSATNQCASDMIGQVWQSRGTVTGGQSQGFQGGGSENSGYSFTEQLAAQLLPAEFTTLAKGGPANGLCVEGIVCQAGRVWEASGANYLRVTFHQGVR